MSQVGVLALLTLAAVGGLLMAIGGWMQPAPTLTRVLSHLRRPPLGLDSGPGAGSAITRRMAPPLLDALRGRAGLMPSDAELMLVGRRPEQHVVLLVASVLGGLVAPVALLALLQAAGLVSLMAAVPVIAGVGGAVLAPIVLHAATVERAAAIRNDLRYQASAYLDVVTMLLAGNTGYEGALEQAASAGDGRLFGELRRRMRESGARGASLTDALAGTGRELGVEELEQIAATASLSAAEGAPVARTLAAKCATLRSALATEQETEARLRTSRLTTPVVGMALIFMALVIYPALSIT